MIDVIAKLVCSKKPRFADYAGLGFFRLFYSFFSIHIGGCNSKNVLEQVEKLEHLYVVHKFHKVQERYNIFGFSISRNG